MSELISGMTNSMFNRGPDGEGSWFDNVSGIALGHRRLAIIDVSNAGCQPMHSVCGRYVISFNGEIYNALELKKELGHISFKGHSDTEVLLEACALWGVEKTLQKVNGMFAFAIWDKKLKRLCLARDRFGVKPLYWGMQNQNFIFASELKALRKYKPWNFEVSRNALASYMRYNYVPCPQSIFNDVYKLKPGHMLTIDPEKKINIKCYWDPKKESSKALDSKIKYSDKEAIDKLEQLLISSVSLQMLSDVPLGAFLSGGIDSSTVVALMQSNSNVPVSTFSIGFEEESYNEAHYAKLVAKHLGTAHTELYVSPQDAIDVLPSLPMYWDEPFSDSSQIPTFLLSKLTREHVKVSLSGDGGDELFAGYNRYLFAKNISKTINKIPKCILSMADNGVNLISPCNWTALSNYIPKLNEIPNFGDKLYKFTKLLGCRNVDETYFKLISNWDEATDVVLNSVEERTEWIDDEYLQSMNLPIQKMQLIDTMTYLPDDILTKVDRASMAASLEARVPLLDHRIFEFAWGLPFDMKIRNGESKWILRQVLYKYVPKELIERPKMGFGVPIGEWLRTLLREWAENLLDEKKLKEQGYFNSKLIRQKWEEHLSGNRNWQYHLWSVLMFQAWHEHWIEKN
jgi:asparagine synthase (glutamine-hydrolysing)